MIENNIQGQPSQLTFGARAVGLTFNPSGDDKVAKAKQLFAEIIDLVDNHGGPNTGLGSTFSKKAIEESITAQMWVVKFLTFKN